MEEESIADEKKSEVTENIISQIFFPLLKGKIDTFMSFHMPRMKVIGIIYVHTYFDRQWING